MERYDQCDETCTTDCGHCKSAGRPKVPVDLGDLRGPDGNAFAVLANVRHAFENAGRLPEFAAVNAEAMTSDYDHLLDTVLKYCDDIDQSIDDLRLGDPS
jgi:hypothetical protein